MHATFLSSSDVIEQTSAPSFCDLARVVKENSGLSAQKHRKDVAKDRFICEIVAGSLISGHDSDLTLSDAKIRQESDCSWKMRHHMFFSRAFSRP